MRCSLGECQSVSLSLSARHGADPRYNLVLAVYSAVVVEEHQFGGLYVTSVCAV